MPVTARSTKYAARKPAKRRTRTIESNTAGMIAASVRAAGIPATRIAGDQFRFTGDIGAVAAAMGRLGKDLRSFRITGGPPQNVEVIIGPATPARAREATLLGGSKARALLRGLAIKEADLAAAGGTVGLEEVTRLLRISRQAVDKKVKDNALLAVPGPSNRRQYPEFQFCGDGVVKGLRDVLRALPSRDPWFRLNFLVNPEPRLGGKRPCDLLQQGQADAVAEAARRIGVMGA